MFEWSDPLHQHETVRDHVDQYFSSPLVYSLENALESMYRYLMAYKPAGLDTGGVDADCDLGGSSVTVEDEVVCLSSSALALHGRVVRRENREVPVQVLLLDC